MWGMRILFSLQVVPQVMQFTCSILYAVSNFHLSGFSLWDTTTKTKNSWLPAQDKPLVDISPLVFQLNL